MSDRKCPDSLEGACTQLRGRFPEGRREPEVAWHAVPLALEAGFRHIDTAHMCARPPGGDQGEMVVQVLWNEFAVFVYVFSRLVDQFVQDVLERRRV